MRKYLIFLKKKLYMGILIILGFAMLGSVLGARKESKEPLNGIMEEDLLLQEENRPELAGVLPLAANQNKWYNFQFAFGFGIIGIIVWGVLMILYLKTYDKHFFVVIRSALLMEEK